MVPAQYGLFVNTYNIWPSFQHVPVCCPVIHVNSILCLVDSLNFLQENLFSAVAKFTLPSQFHNKLGEPACSLFVGASTVFSHFLEVIEPQLGIRFPCVLHKFIQSTPKLLKRQAVIWAQLMARYFCVLSFLLARSLALHGSAPSVIVVTGGGDTCLVSTLELITNDV